MRKGFTLIELLSVIVVIAIISVIVVPALTGVINKARLNALKDTAYGLIESSNLYYAQYQNDSNIRFDISNNKVVSSDTTNTLKYKGTIKEGVSIIKDNGQTVVCVTDGKNSAYKNYNESKVSLVSGKVCTIPAKAAIVYLDGNATVTELTNQELTDEITALKEEIASLKSSKADKKDITSKEDIYPVGSIYMSADNTNPSTLFGGTWVKIEGRFLLGSSSSYTLGSTGGKTSVNYTPQGTVGNHTLTVNEIPNHTHITAFNWQDGGGTSLTQNEPWAINMSSGTGDGVGTWPYGSDNGSTRFGWTGGSQAHNHPFTGTQANINIMNPYIVVNIWKRTA